jgi:hypothetical protein
MYIMSGFARYGALLNRLGKYKTNKYFLIHQKKLENCIALWCGAK